MSLTANRVRELLDYDPETGKLTWLVTRGRTAKRGQIAGSLRSDGYIRLTVDGARYYAHRLVWLHFYGAFPDGEIDHVNCEKTDNRITNLRLATKAQNCCNRGVRIDNSSGSKGVHWHKRIGKWTASIKVGGKRRSLGYFNNVEDAADAYRAAAASNYGAFARFE